LEIGTVLSRIHISLFFESFNTHQVAGLILSSCESVDEMMSIGVTTVMHARGLLVKIRLWNECGVDHQLLQVSTCASTTPVCSPHLSTTTTTTAPLTQSVIVSRVDAAVVSTSVEEAVYLQSPVTHSFIYNGVKNASYIGEPWIDGLVVFGIGFLSVSNNSTGYKCSFRCEGQWLNGKPCGHGVVCKTDLEMNMSVFDVIYPESGYLILSNILVQIGFFDHKLRMNGFGLDILSVQEVSYY
jgi:hypothetical protein